jgi:hypothetical protein
LVTNENKVSNSFFFTHLEGGDFFLGEKGMDFLKCLGAYSFKELEPIFQRQIALVQVSILIRDDFKVQI